MKRLLWLLLFALLPFTACWAQTVVTTHQVIQWQPQPPQQNPPFGTVYEYLDQTTGKLVCKDYLGGSACPGGGGGSGTVTNSGNLTACQPAIGTGTVGIQASKGFCYASLEPGATADVKWTNALNAAVTAGGFDVVIDLQGAQTIASQPFAGTTFHGYVTVLPGAQYTCTANPCIPVPTKVTLDWLEQSFGTTTTGFTSGGSYLISSIANEVFFCLGAVSPAFSACPVAGGTVAQDSMVKHASVHGNNVSGVVLFQNYVGQEGSGYQDVFGVASCNHGIGFDIGGGQTQANNSTLSGNISNSPSSTTVCTQDSVNAIINSGANGFLARIAADITATNSCLNGAACSGTGPDDNIEVCGNAISLSGVHVENGIRAGVILGICKVAGVDTAIATANIDVDTLTSAVTQNTIEITSGVKNVNFSGILNANTSAGFNTIVDLNNANIVAASHQGVASYITGDTSQVIVDSSGTNPPTAMNSSTTQVLYNLAGVIKGSSNFTFAANSGISLIQGSNGSDALAIQRLTNSAPTGNFLDCLNASAASVCNIDVLGNMTGKSFTTTSDGTHAGLLSIVGNTTVPTSLPANSFGFIGPNSASFTSYFLQPSSTAPSGSQLLSCGTPSSNVSACTWVASPSTAESSITGSTGATTVTETGATFAMTYAGVATANLTAPRVFLNTNSSNNNTSIGLGISTPGTSTGQTTLNVNGAATGGDLIDAGTGGTWTAGVLSGQTIVHSITITGAGLFGAATNPTTGTSGGVVAIEGTAFTGTSTNYGWYNDSTLHCLDIIDQTTNIGCALGETAIVGANLVLKAVGTTSKAVGSSITDDGTVITASEFANFTTNRVFMVADWTCGTGGTVSSCTAATIVGSTGTPLTLTLPNSAQSWHFHCHVVVTDTTATPANNWAMITASHGATNVTASYSGFTAAAVAAGGSTTDTASTTTTFNIGGTWTQGATATKMPYDIDAWIEGASASGTTVSLQVVDPTVADLLTIYRGAYCTVGAF